MSKANRVLLFASCLCLALFSCDKATAQEKTGSPDFGDGTLEKVADKMERLLELEWNGEGIALKRDWDKKKKKKADGNDKDQELKEAVEALIEQGVPEAQAKKMAKQMNAHGRFGGMRFHQQRPGVEKAFFAIPSQFGGMSRGSSGSGERRRLSFSTSDLSGIAMLANDDVRFAFEENGSSERSFELRDTGDGKVQFTFAYDQFFLRFLQTQKGATQLIWVNKDQVKVYTGDTFADFIQKNPAPTKQLLFPLLDRLGVKMPLDKMDPRLLSAVIARLERMHANEDEKVKQLVKDLDSDSFKTRKTASEELANGYQQWSDQIAKYASDSSLSPEGRTRLKEIIGSNDKSEIEQFMDDQNLLESTPYLVKLLEVADDKQKALVAEQLKQVTGEEFGEDLEAWTQWLLKNKN